MLVRDEHGTIFTVRPGGRGIGMGFTRQWAGLGLVKRGMHGYEGVRRRDGWGSPRAG